MTKEKEFISKSGLKCRGWTDLLIKTFLPEPDKTCPNPYYKSAAPTILYKINRVESIELTNEFILAKEKADKRKLSANKAVETKTNKTIEWASNLPEPKLKTLTKEKLIRKSVNHYNERLDEFSKFDSERATIDSDDKFLNRICVNYVRHVLTDYEDSLVDSFGMVGKSEAIDIIRLQVYKVIAKTYNWLKSECKNQLSFRGIDPNLID